MKKKGLLWVFALSLAMGLAVNASAALLAYEGFDMVGLSEGGSILGRAGQTSFGFSENFRSTYNSPKFVAQSLALDGTNLSTRGGSVTLSTSGGNTRVMRNFSQSLGAVDGTYYMSLLYSSGKEVTFDLSDGDYNANRKCTLGREGSTGDIRLVVYNAPAPNYKDIASAGQVHFYVLKFKLGSSSDTISVYVDPDPLAPEPAVADASFTVSNFLVDRIRSSCFNTSAIGLLDEFRLGETFADVVPIPGAAIHVAPADRATGVALDSVLQWQVGNDPNEAEGIHPWGDVAGYYVYFGNNIDPNLYLMTPAALPVETPSYAPVLAVDRTYFWQIEETFDNGQGGVYAPGDPNNVLGPVWTFESLLTVPTISQHPVGITRTAAGSTAELSVAAQNALHYAWYRSADNSVGGDTSVGADSATLTLTNVQLADEGYYYCVVSNNSPTTAISTMSQLVINRLLAGYRFENNLDDSVGTNPATPMGLPMRYAQGIITADLQTYAADPNGSMYGILPTGCYPKTGIGNGMEQFTYSAWVKLADSTQGGHLFGQFKGVAGTYQTALRFSINVTGYDVSTYLRNETNTTSLIADVGGLNVEDNQWHYVAVTFNGSQVITYFDGRAVQTVNTSISDFADWDQPFPLLAVNARGTMDGYFKGSVDDLKILNYPLIAEDIAQTYYDVTGKKVCLYGNPALDLSGNCIVDLADLMMLAADWLKNGFYPID